MQILLVHFSPRFRDLVKIIAMSDLSATTVLFNGLGVVMNGTNLLHIWKKNEAAIGISFAVTPKDTHTRTLRFLLRTKLLFRFLALGSLK